MSCPSKLALRRCKCAPQQVQSLQTLARCLAKFAASTGTFSFNSLSGNGSCGKARSRLTTACTRRFVLTIPTLSDSAKPYKCVAPPGRSLGSAIRRTPLSRRSQRRHLCRIIKYRLPAWVSQAVVTSRDQCDHPLCNRSVPIWNRKPAAAETCSAYFDGWHWCVAQNALAFLRLSLSEVYRQAMQKAAHASSSHVPGTGAPCHLCWAISHPPSGRERMSRDRDEDAAQLGSPPGGVRKFFIIHRIGLFVVVVVVVVCVLLCFPKILPTHRG